MVAFVLEQRGGLCNVNRPHRRAPRAEETLIEPCGACFSMLLSAPTGKSPTA